MYNVDSILSKVEEEVQITLEEEREFIRQMNISEHSVMILAFLNGEFVGNCSFSGNNIKRQKHRVSMGIALFQKYTGMGIGKILIEKLLQIAKEKGFEQMELEVAAENERAVHLYKKLGFQILLAEIYPEISKGEYHAMISWEDQSGEVSSYKVSISDEKIRRILENVYVKKHPKSNCMPAVAFEIRLNYRDVVYSPVFDS